MKAALGENPKRDLVLWSGDLLDVLSRAEHVFMDGVEIYSYEAGEGRFAEL